MLLPPSPMEQVLNIKKRLLGDHVGQTLGGAEKLCGDIANQYLRKHGIPFTSIEVWSLLIDYSTTTAEVFKVCLEFVEQKSEVYRGTEMLDVNVAFNRVLDQLVG